MAASVTGTDAEVETREKLLRTVKKEVKQIMEEAVTRKFVHEESSSITSLCGAVESCLTHGLKKRALGLFKNSTTTALLQKVGKNYEPATQIVKMLSEIENNNDPNKKSLDNNKNQTKKLITSYNPKYLWIRLALFEKQLAKIIDHLVQNNSKYYEKEALLTDPVDGPILASLLVGPCALDYTKMKTPDHFWTDPPADELVQRHRIHSSTAHHIGRPDSPKRPGLQVRRNTSSSSEDSMRTAPPSAKEYVESLHQNTKNTLLYGKNNVHVQPKEDVSPLPGYLSLHQSLEGLTLKWTPNQLMNGCCQEEKENTDVDRRPVYAKYRRWKNGSRSFLYWDYAVTVFLDEIVYLHCHQQPDSGGTIVLVGQDGVQRPPIHFPKGGHLLAFLSCLENGLLPHGQLDPPLWAQRGKGKVFPKLKRKGSRLSQKNGSQLSEDYDESAGDSEEEASDYVFRIISTFKPENMPPEMLDPKANKEKGLGLSFPWPVMRGIGTPSPLTQTPPPVPPESTIQSYARTQEQFNNTCLSRNGNHRSVVKQLCDTMKKQIISRAFYGWLAHCRHLKTVRTHLSGLVNGTVISVEDPHNASQGLTFEIWNNISKGGVVTNESEIYRLVYYGGCEDSVRKEVWPYLLGHYKFGSTEREREELEDALRTQYETTMSEWLAVEAIVRQRDKEIMAANLKKLSSESNDGHIPLIRKDSSLSNDVFEEIESSDATDEFSHPDTLPEESSTCATTPSTTPHVSAQPSIDRSSEGKITPIARGSPARTRLESSDPDEGLGDSVARTISLADSRRSDSCDTDNVRSDLEEFAVDKNIIVTNPSMDSGDIEGVVEEEEDGTYRHGDEDLDEEVHTLTARYNMLNACDLEDRGHLSASRESLISPASAEASNGGVYSTEMLDNVALNLHRIDKDVQRCDRNYWYFTPANLEKLRNVMCTYVWEHLEVGYVQGMCDLVAPLLVIFDDEAKTYSCFCQLMKRMSANFPHGGAMDTHFANMRSLIQILDSELFEHMHQNGDYTHFYFCYRWFLLDFKRELVYDDVFAVWETIWAAKHISSSHFVLFIALALVEYYRDIILDNNMDFTDIIKFFNEMAERHNAKQVLKISRDLVHRLQDMIENK